MARHDIAFVIEQRGTWHGLSPVGTIPGVDLHAHAEAVEVNLKAVIHGEAFIRNLGSAVIVSQSGEATAQEQRQRSDGGFVGGKRRPYKRSQPAKDWRFIDCFHLFCSFIITCFIFMV
jgi:hypothetical protein